MYLKANNTPASAPGDFVWDDEDAVVEVPDELGTQLLKTADQFREVLPSDPEHPEYVAPDPADVEPQSDLGPSPEEDLIGARLAAVRKPCGKEGCGNLAKPGQDFCHWHQPKD